MKPVMAPRKTNGADAGINIAVAMAVVAMRIRSIPVFSAVPSMVIMLESWSSHQGASE